MQASPEESSKFEVPLQLLLFVDKRPGSTEQIRRIRVYLKNLRTEYPFDLQVIDVEEQPYLAEHFKLVATPALVKIHPEPRQTLAGSNLINQLGIWWHRWQRSVEDYLKRQADTPNLTDDAVEEEQNETGSSTALKRHDSESASLVMQSIPSTIARSTEILRLSDEIFRLKQEVEQLQEQLQFKDHIIAMLAHDLRNPLTATSIALETLELGSSKDGQPSRLTPALTAQLLRHARTQTKAIDRMITDILQAARGTNAELPIQPQQLDLVGLCKDVLDHLKERFRQKNQYIETDIPTDLPLVYADKERIRQVLTNLLDNAAKYTPEGGKIQITVLHRTTQKVQVSICDNGPGIPLENQERIFEEHFRLERDTAQDGYGLGLALCQRVVRAHYGQIWVDANANQGSCFHFTLPVHRS
ncbi:MAG: histidine kinase [Scytolyngbya sp. HA4215-MV1]|jgi:two-component system clock-associated histidine kinase SasA|nr:histidine kinase [Scytolyngbya sp. HA4215-MV1]